MSDKYEPAFPREDYQTQNAGGQTGMSLRDYFAAKAMQAFITSDFEGAASNSDKAARWAYEQADAMLKQRKANER